MMVIALKLPRAVV
ncbi:hypothetical protein D018_1268A, partial [Vibrio parahaemolyticus VP2007-007]